MVYETLFIMSRDAKLASALPNICLMLLGILFSYAIYNGAQTLTYLVVLGGFYSVISSFANDKVIDYLRTAGDVPYNIYMTILAVVAAIQIVLFIYIGISRKYRKYFEACIKINQKLGTR